MHLAQGGRGQVRGVAQQRHAAAAVHRAVAQLVVLGFWLGFTDYKGAPGPGRPRSGARRRPGSVTRPPPYTSQSPGSRKKSGCSVMAPRSVLRSIASTCSGQPPSDSARASRHLHNYRTLDQWSHKTAGGTFRKYSQDW